MQRTYYTPLNEQLFKRARVVLRTEPEEYFVDAVDLLIFLLKKWNVILVTFDRTTRDLVDRVEYQGGDIQRLRIVDAVSIIEGRGTPPIHHVVATYRPYDFNDIQVYTGLFAREFKFKDVVVVYLAMNRLELYQNVDEVGIFLYTTKLMSRNYDFSEVIFMHTETKPVLASILSKDADKIIPVRKMPIFLGGGF